MTEKPEGSEDDGRRDPEESSSAASGPGQRLPLKVILGIDRRRKRLHLDGIRSPTTDGE